MKIIGLFIILNFMFLQTVFPQAISDSLKVSLPIKLTSIERIAATNILSKDVKIYPNPTDGELTIEFENPTHEERLELLDLLGNIVFESPYHKVINLAFLAKGVYFLKLIDKSNRIIDMERIIKK